MSIDDPAPPAEGAASPAVSAFRPGSDEESAGRHSRWRFADVEFDEAEGLLRVAGKPVVVEPRPLRLLLEMLRHVGEVVTKEELLVSVWEARPTVDHVLANAVSKLRTALGEQGAARLSTLPRVGYRLAGPVQRLATRAPEVVLQAGQPVPGREGYLLERSLGHAVRQDVWLARHAKLGHEHVFKFADDGARLSALKREYTLYRVLQQELGQRNDFAVVIDTNFVVAPYFLECEYGGLSLAELAQQPVTDGLSHLQALSAAERLSIFIQICRAVAAAHSVGVLHKDIKPGNVLIGGEPGHWQIRLTDFGSGRLLDRERLQGLQLTAEGLTQEALADSRSATMMYLAPEVAAGQASSMQSDVYALGLLLLQMMTADLHQGLSTGWQRRLDDDLLVADIAAATEGHPEDRLSSAAELAGRLEKLPQRREERRLAAQAEARQQQVTVEWTRSRARRPWVAAAFVCLLAGLLVSAVLYRDAQKAYREAREQGRRAAAVNDFLTKDLLVTLDLGRAGADRPLTMLDLLRRGSASASQRFAGQPLLESEARHHLAQTFARLWSMRDADAEYTRAIELRQGLVPAADETLLTMRYEQVLVLYERNQAARGQQLFDATEAAAGPQVASARSELGLLAMRGRVTTLYTRQRLDAALAEARRLLLLADEVPGDAGVNRIEARRLLADVLSAHGDIAEADRLLADLQQAPFDQRAESYTAISHVLMMRAARHRDAGRFAEAEALLLDVQARLARSPAPSGWHQGYAHSELGHVYRGWEQQAKAATQYKLALGHFRRTLGDEHQFVRLTELNLMAAELDSGHYADAWSTGMAAKPWFDARAAQGREYRLDMGLGRALLALKRPREALAHLEAIPAPTSGEKADTLAGEFTWAAQGYRGMALLAMGQASQGLALVREARQQLDSAGKLPTGQPDLYAFLTVRR